MYEYEISVRVLPDYDITATDVSEIEMEAESGQLYPDYSGPYSVDAAMYDQTLETQYKNMTGNIVLNAVEEVNGVVTLPTAEGEAQYIDINDKSGPVITQYHAKEDYSVGITPIQTGTGDPYPAGGGKNKADILLLNSGDVTVTNGIATGTASAFNAAFGSGVAGLAIPSNTQLTMSAKAYTNGSAGTSGNGLSMRFIYTDNSVEAVNWSNNTTTATRKSVTSDSSKTIAAVVFTFGSTGGNTWYLSEWQIEVGNTVSDFAPYSNIRPISGWTGAHIYVAGKNLFNASVADWENGYNINASGDEITGNSYAYTQHYYPVKPSTTYSIQIQKNTTTSAQCAVAEYSADKSFIIRDVPISPTSSTGTLTGQFTTAANTAYIRIVVPYHTTESLQTTNIMYELGATASTYVAYQGNTYNIDWTDEAGTVYGGTLDATLGKLIVTHVLWQKNSSTMNNGEAYPGWEGAGIASILGTGLNKIYTGVVGNIGTTFGVNTTSGRDILYLPKGNYGKNQTEWKSLAQDVQFVMKLAAPLEYTLSPTEIQLLIGQNNVWADCGDITVTWGVQ